MQPLLVSITVTGDIPNLGEKYFDASTRCLEGCGISSRSSITPELGVFIIDPFNRYRYHDFSGSLPSGATQPDVAGIIRRPAGWTPIPAGKSTTSPIGSTAPLSAALSSYRVIAADAALHLVAIVAIGYR